MMATDDRRREHRIEFATRVEVSKGKPGEWCKAIARDISAGGMFLHTDFECSLQDELTIRFLLPETSSHLELTGRVARRDLAETDDVLGMVGVGLEFESPGWILEELKRFVEAGLKTGECGIVPAEKPENED